ncbi:hypothetical protein EGW08_005927, partial [Elysia chlorotica]
MRAGRRQADRLTMKRRVWTLAGLPSLALALLCLTPASLAANAKLPPGSVDLVERFGLRELAESNAGVEKVAGLCPHRVLSEDGESEETVEDPAYRITDAEFIPMKKIDEVFRMGHLPDDFSIITTVRASSGVTAKLFALYDDSSAFELLSLEVGEGPRFVYRDIMGRPGADNSPKFDNIVTNDGEWHRLALSVKGRSAT